MLHSKEFFQTVILIVKPVFHPFRTGVLAAVAAILMLAGCGQKGPLFLPVKPVPVTTTPATPPADNKQDNK
jgi:predicted small lipoprotein YifL